MNTLESTAKPVTDLKFPAVTICAGGLFIEHVKDAVEQMFNRWRLAERKSWMEPDVDHLMAEFMEEKFQMQSRNVTIMDILDTMITPNEVDNTLVSNAVRENVQACAASEGQRRRKREAKEASVEDYDCHERAAIRHTDRDTVRVEQNVGSWRQCLKLCIEEPRCNCWLWVFDGDDPAFNFQCVLMASCRKVKSGKVRIVGPRLCNEGPWKTALAIPEEIELARSTTLATVYALNKV